LIPNKNADVLSRGNIPLFKEAKFERAVQKWTNHILEDFANQFKKQLQIAEHKILKSFKFKKELSFGLN